MIIALLAEWSKGEHKGRTSHEPLKNIYSPLKGLLCHQRMYKLGISPQADGKWHTAGHKLIRLVKIKSLNPTNQLPVWYASVQGSSLAEKAAPPAIGSGNPKRHIFKTQEQLKG